MKINITSNKDIKDFFAKNKFNIYGLASNAFDRALSEKTFPGYTILALQRSLDTDIISKRIKTFVVEDFIGDKVYELEKNASSIIGNQQIQSILKKTKRNYILTYNGRDDVEQICKENNWVSAVGSSHIGKAFLEDKIKFRKYLAETGIVNYPKSIFRNVDTVKFDEVKDNLGEKFVIQIPSSSGGKGTFFVNNEDEFKSSIVRVKEFLKEGEITDRNLLISQFVTGRSASISLVVTRWGTFVSPIQYQITDIPEISTKEKGTGLFIGHDWSASQNITNELNTLAFEIGKKFGDSIYKLGFKGFCGIDLLIDNETEEFNIIECNGRFTGAMPTLDMIQESNDLALFSSIHLLEYIAENEDIDINLDYNSLQSEIQRPKQGTHFHISTKSRQDVQVIFNFKPGVYKLINGGLSFQRDGFNMFDLTDEEEFILTEMPNPSAIIKKYHLITRVLTKTNVLDEKGNFNKFGKDISRAFYEGIQLNSL